LTSGRYGGLVSDAGHETHGGDDPLARYSLHPEEGRTLAAAHRAGGPFFAYRQSDATLAIFTPQPRPTPLYVGRGDGMDLRLLGDPQVSRVHAELHAAGAEWLIKNLSRNHTFVNARRITDTVRLAGGDRVRVGQTVLAFLRAASEHAETALTADAPRIEDLSETQRRILVALCRPLLGDSATGAAASNSAIVAEVHLGIDAVKDHLGRMYAKFGFGHLEQNQKRANLAVFAVRNGLVRPQDL
jgi:hypothetical protein